MADMPRTDYMGWILPCNIPLPPPPHCILPPNINKQILSFRIYGGEFLFEGHRMKVKGRIGTNLLRDTPLSPDTSSYQLSTKNLHSFRKYGAEGNFGFKVTGSRSKRSHRHEYFVRHTFVPDTSSHQISTKNLHLIRRYRAESNYDAI
jgi:hypothetical protein